MSRQSVKQVGVDTSNYERKSRLAIQSCDG